jgi:hypothetical protein
MPFVTLADFRKRCDAMLANSKIDAVDTLRQLCSDRIRSPPHRNFRFSERFIDALLLSARRAALVPAPLCTELRSGQIAPLCAGTRDMSHSIDRRAAADRAGGRQTPAIRQLMQSDRLEELPNQLAVHPAAAPFVASFEAFIADYGHRGTREAELAVALAQIRRRCSS